MNTKMIITDLDRTLLRTDKSISDYSVDVFNRCRANGIKVVFATARPKRTVKHFVEKIPSDALILHNGAVIFVGDKLHTCFGIDPIIRDNILLSINRDFPETTLSVEIEDVLYANFDVSVIWNETPAVRTDFTDLPNKLADKIIIGSAVPLDVEKLAKYIPCDLYLETSSGENMNLELIMNRKATKWEAVKILLNQFDIQAVETVAFGDDYNDISMIEGCGIGVAVANSISDVKAVSDYICDSNDNDGVAKWLNENVL